MCFYFKFYKYNFLITFNDKIFLHNYEGIGEIDIFWIYLWDLFDNAFFKIKTYILSI